MYIDARARERLGSACNRLTHTFYLNNCNANVSGMLWNLRHNKYKFLCVYLELYKEALSSERNIINYLYLVEKHIKKRGFHHNNPAFYSEHIFRLFIISKLSIIIRYWLLIDFIIFALRVPSCGRYDSYCYAAGTVRNTKHECSAINFVFYSWKAHNTWDVLLQLPINVWGVCRNALYAIINGALSIVRYCWSVARNRRYVSNRYKFLAILDICFIETYYIFTACFFLYICLSNIVLK